MATLIPMGLPESRSADELRASWVALAAGDLAWNDESAFGYVYPAPPEVASLAAEAHRAFSGANGLDPTAFPSLATMENDLVRFGRELAGGDEEVVGAVSSGGTESIMLAVKAARDRLRAGGVAGRLNIVLPETAHAAFYKAAAYLDVDVRTISTRHGFLADPDALIDACDGATALMAVSAPSYTHGVIDPIEEVAAKCLPEGVWLHVDACVGGFVLPFLPDPSAFGFDIPGVSSVSIDIHKYGYAPKGTSLILYRHRELRAHQFFATADWTGYPVVNTTVQSTKSGGPLAAAWATVHALGSDGYQRLVDDAMSAADEVRAAIDASPHLELLGDPATPLLGFTAPNVFALSAALRQRGWFASPTPAFGTSPAHIHLTLTAVHRDAAARFSADLATSAEETAGTITEDLLPPGMTLDTLDPEALRQLLASIDLTEDRPAINKALDALDPKARAEALIAFMDGYFTP